MNRAFSTRDIRHLLYGAPALTLMLAGCVSLSDIQQSPAISPDVALRTRAIAVAGTALTEKKAPTKWWELFNDQTLAALETEALTSNLDLRAAIVRIDASRAQLGIASSARLPQLSIDESYARRAISENSPNAMLGAPTNATSNWNLGLSARWELDLWGRLRHMQHSAEASLQATHYSKEAATVAIGGEVARTYLLLRGVQTQKRIVKENREIAHGLVRMAESRKRNGVATRYDAAAARADLAGIEARLSQLQHQCDALMNALALLLGKPPRELDERLAAKDLPPMPQRLPIGIPSELARMRPDILQADAQLRAALSDIGVAKADFYPRISLLGGLGLQSFDLSDLGSWDSRHYTLGPTLYLPIFEGGRLKSQLELTKARHRLAAIAYQQTVLKAWHEVDDALGAYTSELKRHDQLKLAQEQNQTALKIAQRGYDEGTTDFTTVLMAQRSLLASQSALADSATASALSVVSLYRALGSGWSSELHAGVAQ